jgi:hypothetical protein
MTIQLREPWHGTRGGYTNHKCRCEACSACNTAYSVALQADPDRRERHRIANQRWYAKRKKAQT